MQFVIILAIAIGILYWFKQKGVKKDREIELEKQRRELARREAKQKQEDREAIKELKEEIARLNEKLDEDVND